MRPLLLLAFASCAAALSCGVNAQTNWPEKSVTVVVPFPAGGATDAAARAMATQMQTTLGQSFVVDNKPGATGTLGAGTVKRAAPDGYTLMVSSLGTYVIAPHLFKSVPYDALKDFDYPAVRDKIAASAAAAIRDPKVAARLTEQGLEIVANTPAEFTAFQAREFARWKSLIDTRKITAD